MLFYLSVKLKNIPLEVVALTSNFANMCLLTEIIFLEWTIQSSSQIELHSESVEIDKD